MERSVAERNLPIQVAALCDTTGKLHPLWFRYADEAHQVRKVNIDAVLSQKTLRYVGIRMEQYICAQRLAGAGESMSCVTAWRTTGGIFFRCWMKADGQNLFSFGCKQRIFELERRIPGDRAWGEDGFEANSIRCGRGGRRPAWDRAGRKHPCQALRGSAPARRFMKR